jgi:hypothetical protein
MFFLNLREGLFVADLVNGNVEKKFVSWWPKHPPSTTRRPFVPLTIDELEALRAGKIADAAARALIKPSENSCRRRRRAISVQVVPSSAGRRPEIPLYTRGRSESCPYLPVYRARRPRRHSSLSPTLDLGFFNLYDYKNGSKENFIKFLEECMTAEDPELLNQIISRDDFRRKLVEHGLIEEGEPVGNYLVYRGPDSNQLAVVDPAEN